MDHGDSEWITNKIKHEEPLEFFLISPTTDEELNIDFDKNFNLNDEHLEDIPLIKVKEEVFEHLTPEYEAVPHSVNIKNEFELVEATSDNGGDSEHNEDKNGLDDDWSAGKNTKSKSQKKQQRISPKISTAEDITCKGPLYTCNICSLTFPIKKSLKAHRNIHKGKTLQCDICKKVYRSKSHIYEHMKVHFAPQFRCPICSKEYALKKSFLRHQAIHEEKSLECDYCSKRFRQKGHIREHMKMHQERTKHIKCEICGIAYYEQRTLNRHMKNIHSTAQRKRYRCPNALCDKSCSSIGAFKLHACVDGKRPQKFCKKFCTLCDKRFFNQFGLQRHMKRAHVSKPDNYQCAECNRTFMYRYYGSYVLHAAQNCAKNVAYECDYCSKIIPSKAKLIEHFAGKHHIVNIANVQSCPHCETVFFNTFNLMLHLKKNHIVSKCDYCNRTCRSKHGLSLHLKKCLLKKTFDEYSKQITDSGSLECSVCKCSFITTSNLLEHMKKVHLEKNFELAAKTDPISTCTCTICHLSFANRISLSKHKKHLHNKRLFKCRKCNVKFKCKNSYRAHLRNSVCKRYQCTICSKNFTRNSNLNRHFKLIHSAEAEILRCDICNRTFRCKQTLKRHFGRGDHQFTFQCEICQRIFKRMATCNTHMINCKANRKKEL